MIEPWTLNRFPEALGFDRAISGLSQVACGDVQGFGMDIHGLGHEEILSAFEPTLKKEGFGLTGRNTTGFYSGGVEEGDDGVYGVHGQADWHVDLRPDLNGPPVQTINFHFTPVGCGRAYFAKIRSERLTNFGDDWVHASRQNLSRGFVDTDFLQNTVRVTPIGLNRLVVFGSVGRSPALHKFISSSDGRYSKVYYANYCG